MGVSIGVMIVNKFLNWGRNCWKHRCLLKLNIYSSFGFTWSVCKREFTELKINATVVRQFFDVPKKKIMREKNNRGKRFIILKSIRKKKQPKWIVVFDKTTITARNWLMRSIFLVHYCLAIILSFLSRLNVNYRILI